MPMRNRLRTTLELVQALIDAESNDEVSRLTEKTALTIGLSIRVTVCRVLLTELAFDTLRREPVVSISTVRPIALVSNNV